MSTNAKITITRHCLCGASMRATTRPPKLGNALAALFDEFHVPGGDPLHGSATSRQAADARRSADRAVSDVG